MTNYCNREHKTEWSTNTARHATFLLSVAQGMSWLSQSSLCCVDLLKSGDANPMAIWLMQAEDEAQDEGHSRGRYRQGLGFSYRA